MGGGGGEVRGEEGGEKVGGGREVEKEGKVWSRMYR